MDLETLVISKVGGFRRETPEVRWWGVVGFRFEEYKFDRKHPITVSGTPPDEGTAIFVGNHRDKYDSIKLFKAMRTLLPSGRIIRTFARHNLLDPIKKESAELLEQIGERDDDLENESFLKRWLRAFVIRGIGAIPVERRAVPLTALRRGTQLLKDGQLVGSFISDTRSRDGTIRGVLNGTAFLAKMNPTVPIYTVATSGFPDEPETVRISDNTLTYAKDSTGSNKEDLSKFTILLADRIVDLSPVRVRNAWQDRRDQELERLLKE